MKTHLLKICFAIVAISGIAMSSCDKEGSSVPAPTLSVPTSLTVAGDGGSFSISYKLTDSVSGGEISCSSDESWITDFDFSISDMVYFQIEENPGTSIRTGNVSVTYSYTDGGKSRSVTERTAVVQYSNGEPDLSVDPNTVSVSFRGGTGSFGYVVNNPTASGQLTCASDADWITDFDYSTYGVVSFSVAQNPEAELRTATITASYAYTGGEASKEVMVVQYHSDRTEGGGDITDIVGTYTAHGTAYGNGFSSNTETEWTVKIYPYDGSDSYDVWVDGLLPWGEGAYNSYGDHRASAGTYVYTNGRLHIPSQMTNLTVTAESGSVYYVGYTPCIAYDSGLYQISYEYPDLTFTYDESTGKWESDYGVFMAGCTSYSLSSIVSFFQVVIPTFTLTKVSSSTSAAVSTSGSSPASGISDAVAHPLTEGLQGFSNFTVR